MFVQRREAAGGPSGYGPSAPAVNWWLRSTSSGWNIPLMTIEEREAARRSTLVSWIILGLLIFDVVLLPLGLGDPSTLATLFVFTVGLITALLLNRRGLVTWAGALIVLLICGGVMGALISEPTGLSLDALPAYDLLAIAVVVGASVLPRAAAFVVASVNILLICLDFFLQPHFLDLQRDILYYGSYAAGSAALLARPIALQIILAVVAFLWVRGTDAAIRRADRAEEIAAMEHAIAAQKRQLDVGIQQILETHVRVANGDFTARAPMNQENVLWQIAASLNNLLTRLQRAGQAEYHLRRTEEELRRLALAIKDAQAGRHPIWPVPSGTPADLVIELIGRSARTAPSHPQLPPMRSSAAQPMPPSMQSSQAAVPAPPWEPWEQWQGQVPPTGPLPSTSPPRQDGDQAGPSNPWIFPPEGEG